MYGYLHALQALEQVEIHNPCLTTLNLQNILKGLSDIENIRSQEFFPPALSETVKRLRFGFSACKACSLSHSYSSLFQL